MGFSKKSWSDNDENYADGYTRLFSVSTADNVIATGNVAGKAVVYSVTLSLSQSNASGDFALVDGSATADSGDDRKFRVVIASAATTERSNVLHADFPRGIVFETGLIVSAATITGAVSITYKQRY